MTLRSYLPAALVLLAAPLTACQDTPPAAFVATATSTTTTADVTTTTTVTPSTTTSPPTTTTTTTAPPPPVSTTATTRVTITTVGRSEQVSGRCGSDLPSCAVMQRESGGDPRAVSPLGMCGTRSHPRHCYGKWQMDPETSQALGYPETMDTYPEAVQDEAARRLKALDPCAWGC